MGCGLMIYIVARCGCGVDVSGRLRNRFLRHVKVPKDGGGCRREDPQCPGQMRRKCWKDGKKVERDKETGWLHLNRGYT